MAPPDRASPPPAAGAMLRRQMSCTSTSSRDEPARLQRSLSCSSASFSSSSSPAASPAPSSASSTTTYHPAASSTKPSCESIPFAAEPELLLLDKQSSSVSSAASSYESFFHIGPDHDGSVFLDIEPPPPTRAPAVQAMTPAAAAATGQQQAKGAECYDPKRLPSAMFRTRSTNPAEWSVASNESLFSIRLSNSGDFGDLYYDAAGFPRFPSMGGGDISLIRMPSVSEGTGGLCLREDCARCSGSGATRKSVRFATTETVSGGSRHSAVSPTNSNAQEPAAASTTAKTPEATSGWCQFGCCWPSLPTMWWPRCCSWHCHCCDCRW